MLIACRAEQHDRIIVIQVRLPTFRPRLRHRAALGAAEAAGRYRIVVDDLIV